MTPESVTSVTGRLLARAAAGDARAHSELLQHAAGRLLRLTRRMLRDYPRLHRWEETDDVFQTAVMRLYQSLSQVKLESVQHFWNLASTQIRRTLIDLARHHLGPQGSAARHDTDSALASGDADAEVVRNVAAPGAEPSSLDDWTVFHEAVDKLPDNEREVFQLLWYAGLSQQESADILGVSLPTVQRRWYAAQVSLFHALHGESPVTRGE
ncbi:MAG: sigma-70 family RNA polymerase sigma factor [Planctomycetes bacterium]|nr:sigma-70 family RNA polymerase sigma factor [Planctomycetota bacterium]